MTNKKVYPEFVECNPPSDEFLEEYAKAERLDRAVVDYLLGLIEESKKVSVAEKHKLTEEITKLYAVLKNTPVG